MQNGPSSSDSFGKRLFSDATCFDLRGLGTAVFSEVRPSFIFLRTACRRWISTFFHEPWLPWLLPHLSPFILSHTIRQDSSATKGTAWVGGSSSLAASMDCEHAVRTSMSHGDSSKGCGPSGRIATCALLAQGALGFPVTWLITNSAGRLEDPLG